MITDEVCEGCGAPLQSEHPEAAGYVPAHVARRGESVICRRCFRITHYGKEEEGVTTDGESAWNTVMEVISTVECCVMIVDILDFEGSFLPDLARAAQGKLIVAVNKVDLLPSKTPAEEVLQWVENRFTRDALAPEGVYCISARSGFGVRVLLEAARKVAGKGARVGLVGAINVGKSTLINRWLKGSQEGGPTVSRFPGTTLGTIARDVEGMNLQVIDTPGLLTRGRVTDILCHQCAANLVPDSSISSKLIRLSPGYSVILGGLAAFTPLGEPNEEHLLLAFAAGEVPIHKVRQEKLTSWMASERSQRGEGFCASCRSALARAGWEQVTAEVAEMEDIAVHGLGWISPRRKGMRIRVTLPAGAMVTSRPRLIGPKTRLPSRPQDMS